MNARRDRSWLMGDGPYSLFWMSTLATLACFVAAAVGLIRWLWVLLPLAGILASLPALHLARTREVQEAYEAEADRLMERVQKRLQLSHPDGKITFEDYVKALKAEGVPGAERFAAEYLRSQTKP